ncbi:MAG TPA: hypothetical protein VFZ08_10605 [Terriglobia bacterium]|nr:hypothetical protein [Terriglobia bacterium]
MGKSASPLSSIPDVGNPAIVERRASYEFTTAIVLVGMIDETLLSGVRKIYNNPWVNFFGDTELALLPRLLVKRRSQVLVQAVQKKMKERSGSYELFNEFSSLVSKGVCAKFVLDMLRDGQTEQFCFFWNKQLVD